MCQNLLFMNKIFLVFSFLIASVLVYAQGIQELPSAETLASINDSIVREAMTLYFYEKTAWLGGDKFADECKNAAKIDGVLTLPNQDAAISTLYYNLEERKCYYEFTASFQQGTTSSSTDVRDLSDYELYMIHLKNHCSEQIVSVGILVGVSPDFGSLNMEMVPLNENLTRVFILSGTSHDKVIPFGNDYSFDFDAEGHLVGYRKYHSRLIPAELSDTNQITELVHSHLHGNPYITSTDICTFLLYGAELYNLKEFSVYSVDYGCYFKFHVETMSIEVKSEE